MNFRTINIEVVKEFGWVAAYLVNHIDYWMRNGRSKYRDEDGNMWFHTTVINLREKGGLPATDFTIKRVLTILQNEKVIYSERPIKNREKRYRLNYAHPVIQKEYKNPTSEHLKTINRKSADLRQKIYQPSTENLPKVGRESTRPNITTKTTIKKQKSHNPGDSNLVFQGSQEQGKNSEINKTHEAKPVWRRGPNGEEYMDDSALGKLPNWEEDPSPTIAPDTTELFRFGNWQLNKLKSWLSSHEYSTEYLRIIWEQSVADAGKPAQDKEKPRLYLETVFLNKLQNTG